MEVNTIFSSETKVTCSMVRSALPFVHGKDVFVAVGDWKGVLTILKYSNEVLSIFTAFTAHKSCISSLQARQLESPDELQLISAGADGMVLIWSVKQILSEKEPTPMQAIGVHKGNVSSIFVTSNKSVLSSSWDGTVQITSPNSETRLLFVDKEQIYFAVELNNNFISCSADCSMTYFDHEGRIIQRINDAHQMLIRQIKYVPNCEYFYTIANDGFLTEWKIEPRIEKHRTLQITDEYIYTLNILNMQIIIGGEDHVVFIVDRKTFTIKDSFPVSSTIWSVNYLPNTDLLVSTEDGYIRVFSKSLGRRAPLDKQKQFLESVANSIVWIPSMQSIDMDDVPSSTNELEQTPGRFFTIKDGNDLVIVLYSKAYKNWLRVGKVHREIPKAMDENGVEFDAKVCVHLENSIVHDLFLNYDDQPSLLAQEFIKTHELSEDLQQMIEATILAQCGDKLIQKGHKKHAEITGVIGNLSYGITEMTGRRDTMEDTHFAVEEGPGIATFGLFDGHGGAEAAEFAADCLPRMIRARRSQSNFFNHLFKDLQNTMKKKFIHVGATALIASFANGILSVANLGDTRCVLCRAKPLRMSFDHRPTEPSELEYITSHGGEVKNGRISGALAVSRSLGDGLFSRFMNPIPYFAEERLVPGDRIVLACDGVFDVLTDETVSQIVRDASNPLKAAKMIREKAFTQMSNDNISVIVIFTKCE